jgi:DNA-repair protein complementing XP-A cells
VDEMGVINPSFFLIPRFCSSPEGLDREFAKRDALTRERKEKQLKKKAIELRKKTRTMLWEATQLDLKRGDGSTKSKGDHEHEYGEAIEIEEGIMQQTCGVCGTKQTYEELGF